MCTYNKRSRTTEIEVVLVEYLLGNSQSRKEAFAQSFDLKTQHVKEDEDDEEEEGSMVLDLGHRFRRVQAHSPLLSQKPQPLFSP